MQEGFTVNMTVKCIARKCTLLVLLELYKGEGHARRFSELKRWALKWKITNIECICQDCSECML